MAADQTDARADARQSFYAKQQLIASAKLTFQQLAAVIKNATVYPAAHPFLLASADQLLIRVNEFLASRREVAFYLVAGELFFETHSIPIDHSLSLLMEQFTSRDVGGIAFTPGLLRDEVVKFAYLMNRDAALLAGQGGVAGAAGAEGIDHIALSRVVLVDKKLGGALKEAKKKSNEIMTDAISTVKEIVQSVSLEKAINMRKVSTMVHTMVDNILDDRDALMGLTSIKMYDEYTFAHSVNVAVLSISLGTFLSFEKPQIAALGIAGMLHDIGKLNVPLEIINKPDKLTDQEWEMMKRHPVEGALILADVPAMTRLAMIAAFEHHQHGDVRGYPRMDDRLQQHPFSQIVAIADSYDAIIAARVYYKVRTPPDQAIRIMLKKRGTAFDPVLVKAFVNMIGIYPVGTLLKLDTGEIGVVTHQTRDLMRPRVLLLTKFDGSEKEGGVEVNLLEMEGGRYRRTAVGTVDPNEAKIDVKLYMD
jgi:HD-GYP domain-containing protein (c-di-GMP phosphodiesterase class II)